MTRVGNLEVGELKRRLAGLVNLYPGIRTIILFGSFARGTQTRHSDIDLVIVMETKSPFFERYQGIHKKILELSKPYNVEFFIYTQGELDSMVAGGNHFIRRVLKEGVVLYER